MHLILTGATGLVGTACLHQMLSNNAVTRVSILSRRPVAMAEGHSKVDVIIHKDYTRYPPEVLEKLKGAKGCVWAQGVSANDVGKGEYEKITLDYPLAAAKSFASLSDPFNFVYVSGEGATTTPTRITPFFGVIKGRAESALLSLTHDATYRTLKPYSLRPAGVDAKHHPEIHDWIPKLKGAKGIYGPPLLTIIRVVYAPLLSPTRELGKVLVGLAMGDGEALDGEGVSGEGRTVSNVGMRKLAGT